MTTAFVDFNGVVPEKVGSLLGIMPRECELIRDGPLMKFDAVKLSHLVDAEYGNQGIDFKMVPREGFGWMNGKCFCLLSICTLAHTC
jgi:alpha,alpha-trehalase